MKKIFFLISVILLFCTPAFADEAKPQEDVELPNIFIWAVPDDGEVQAADKKNKKDKKTSKNDTKNQGEEAEILPAAEEEEPIVLNATTLKGYAEYVEGAEDVLYMDDHTKFVLNIKTPEKIAAESVVDKNQITGSNKNYPLSRFKGEEYYISPRTRNFTEQDGNWSFGTTFNSEISTSQLENKYKKNNMTTTQIQTDNFSVIPELKINNIFALREELSADITRNRRSSELIFSINPLGNKDSERMRFDIGAKQTFDVNTGNTWSQLNFSTNFKL